MSVFRKLLLLLWIHAIAFSRQCWAIDTTLVLAGGGPEGDIGDPTSWSYRLYRELIQCGATTARGRKQDRIQVSILSTEDPPSSFLVDYFEWLGSEINNPITTVAQEWKVSSRSEAQHDSVVQALQESHVIFLRGGDQGLYYDYWNDTPLEDAIRHAVQEQSFAACMGGTSAGAMSQSQFAFAGGRDFIAPDVLSDAQTPYMNDASGSSSGIQTDFLAFLPRTLVDTHFVERGRLGRLAGLLAKANEEDPDVGHVLPLLGIGLEANTGIVVQPSGRIEVIGIGSVTLLQETQQTTRLRPEGEPLMYTQLRLDTLTEGWAYDLQQRKVTQRPADAVSLTSSPIGNTNAGELVVDGSNPDDRDQFQWFGKIYPDDFERRPSGSNPVIQNSIGYCDAGNSETRMDYHETILALLFEEHRDLGLLLFDGGEVVRTRDEPTLLRFGGTSASIVLDAAVGTAKSQSPYESRWAVRNGALRSTALENCRMHVLGDTDTHEYAYNSELHSLVHLGETATPTAAPSPQPSPPPTRSPAANPTILTGAPTSAPVTPSPTAAPTTAPVDPTTTPTATTPTAVPQTPSSPTLAPSKLGTAAPVSRPSISPTSETEPPYIIVSPPPTLVASSPAPSSEGSPQQPPMPSPVPSQATNGTMTLEPTSIPSTTLYPSSFGNESNATWEPSTLSPTGAVPSNARRREASSTGVLPLSLHFALTILTFGYVLTASL